MAVGTVCTDCLHSSAPGGGQHSPLYSRGLGGHGDEIAKPKEKSLDLNWVCLTPGLALLSSHVSLRQSVQGRR